MTDLTILFIALTVFHGMFPMATKQEDSDADIVIEILTDEVAQLDLVPRCSAPTPGQTEARAKEEQFKLDLLKFYHKDIKELNLSNIQMTDQDLEDICPILKTFIESVGVERLIMENANLKTVPFNLIGFTLISKTLKFVSFLGNKFSEEYVLDASSSAVSGDVRPRVDSLVASTVSSVWGNLSPEIERILSEHNSNGSKFHYYNKIIFIDRTMPPVTILDAKRAPYTKYERIKYIMIRVGLFGLGVMVTFVPSIVPWLLDSSKESD